MTRATQTGPREPIAPLSRTGLPHAVTLACFLLLTLVMTYPLIFHFGDHVPGTTTWSMDEYGYVWNNWWFKHAVFDLGTNPFETTYIFYPVGTSLVLYTFTLLHVLLGLPIQLLFGLIPASNAELVFSFVAGGYGVFLLTLYLLSKSRIEVRYQLFAAFVGGSVFAFASNRFVYAALGHYNVVATEWIPFFALYLLKTINEPRCRNAILAGIFAAFAMYVETTDGVLLALFAVICLAVNWRLLWNRRLLARLAIIGCVAGIAFGPLLIPTLSEIFASGYTLPGWGHAEKLLVDLAGFMTPTSLHPLNRNWVQELDQVRQGTSRFVDVNTVFVGYLTLLLAAVGLVRYRRTLVLWGTCAVAFAALSLGPLLHLNGQSIFDLDGLQVTFPLPFLLLHYVPLLKENRVPNRFSVLVMLALAIMIAFAVAWLRGWIERKTWPKAEYGVWFGRGIVSIVLIGLLFEHASIPLPLTDASIPSAYTEIAREPGEFAVLTLPLGWRNSFGQQGAEDTRIQYYQSVSGKPIFAGNIQRNPPELFQYFDRVPIFHSLTELEFYQQVSAETMDRDRQLAPAILSFFNVRYVLVHAAIPGRPPYSDTRTAVLDYIGKVLPLGEQVYDSNGVLAFRVNSTPLPPVTKVDFGSASASLYRAQGWDRDEIIAGMPANWANRPSSRLLFSADEVRNYAVTLRMLPFAYPESPAQTVSVRINGDKLGEFTLYSEWQDLKLEIPARLVRMGINDIRLDFAYAVRPFDVMPSNMVVGQTNAASPSDIVVNSGDLGSIRVGGREASLLGRGYNVVTVDSSGRTSSQVFNTADDRSQSRRMTDFIASLPTGTIVAVASQENAFANLGDMTVAGLRSLGGQLDPRLHPERSHALIGVKGAAPGSAVEKAEEGTSFVAVGHNPDVRTLAAAIASMVIEKK